MSDNIINGGNIPEVFIIDTPLTKKGQYKLARKNYFDDIFHPRKTLNYNLYEAIENLLGYNGETLSGYNPIYDTDKYKIAMDYAAMLTDNDLTSNLQKKYRDAKAEYINEKFGLNNIISQLARYFNRKRNNKILNDEIETSTKGADIIDLSNNVVRLTPESTQNTALFNEFVESQYPTVRTASWYSNNPNARIIDSREAKVSDMNVFGGIEDGKFKIDSLQNFNPSTTIIPARNIKRGIPKITQLVINDNLHGDNVDYSSRAIMERNHINHAVVPLLFTFSLYLEMSDKDKLLIKDLINETDLYLVLDLKDRDRAILQYIDSTKNMEKAIYKFKLPGYVSPDAYIKIAERDINLAMEFTPIKFEHPLKGIPTSEALLNSKNGHFIPFRNSIPFVDLYNNKENDKKTYSFIGEDGKEYPISDYNASVLDGKTVLGNPNGGLFIGRLLDISNEQLQRVNEYLLKNPSWLMRTDLGSFDQYRLDNPTLSDYLKQYFEHPKAEDPNVYVVGTTKDNKFRNGDKLYKQYFK